MKKKVTVKEALRKGQIFLIYLPLIAIFSVIILCFILNNMLILGTWIIPFGLLLGFLSGWLAWSYFVNKWKIWAYKNVRNIHELERKAIEQKLIWKSGSWFEKTEFKNSLQKQDLKLLEKKFLEKDVYNDDVRVPAETRIFYSKSTLIFLFIINVGMISIGALLSLRKEYFGLILLVFGLYNIYDQIKKLRNKNPQIIISDKGIELNNEELVSWNDIHNDRVFSSGRRPNNYLAFNDEMIEIDELTIKFDELENLLNVYRVRFENKNI